MSKRYKVAVAIGVALLIAAIFVVNVFVLSDEHWLFSQGIAIHIVIDNRTDKPIGPFVVSEDQNYPPLRVNEIEPLSVADVYYRRLHSWGENAITMTDSNGKIYPVVYYFENDQRGRVDIRVECTTPDGLSGEKRDLVSWYFSFEWHPWGTSVCK